MTDLEGAAARYAEAKRAWAEAFILYYNTPSKRPRTVAEASAMADIEVDVTKAQAEWEIAKLRCQHLEG